MFRLVYFRRSFAKFCPAGRMCLIKNYSRTLCKASSVNNDEEEKIKAYQSVLLRFPGCFDYPDFIEMHDWLKSSEYFSLKNTTDPHALQNESPELCVKTFEDVAFNTLLYPFRSPSEPEAVLLHYTGHGLSIQQAEKISRKPTFSSPKLDKVGISKEMLKPAEKYIAPGRRVKGGELMLGPKFGCCYVEGLLTRLEPLILKFSDCKPGGLDLLNLLQSFSAKFSYCDLGGILEPWITALTRSPGTKNKHLIVIADSCFSGMLVKDLQKLALEKGPWNQNGCTVTVQSACSQDETTNVGYFTPCFVHFNKPENRARLEKLKREWNSECEVKKSRCRQLNLPSPQIATTMPSDKLSSNLKDPTINFLPHEGFCPLTLFDDFGFFKYCYSSFSGFEVMPMITCEETHPFLKQYEFSKLILDFKLKKTTHRTHLGLFLLKHPDVKSLECQVVRICIHFCQKKPSLEHLTKVNLTSFNISKNHVILGDVLLEYKDAPKYNICDKSGVKPLVEQCLQYAKNKVQKEDPERWANALSWNMTESFQRKKLSEAMMN